MNSPRKRPHPKLWKMISGKTSLLVNLRYFISSSALPHIKDLFVTVLSETLKRAAREMLAIRAALNAAAVSISITLQSMPMISSR
jgi:hypothetical protein